MNDYLAYLVLVAGVVGTVLAIVGLALALQGSDKDKGF